jgi:hypothetical protein
MNHHVALAVYAGAVMPACCGPKGSEAAPAARSGLQMRRMAGGSQALLSTSRFGW